MESRLRVCQRVGIEHAEPICQSILGSDIDAAVGALLLEMMTPLTLEVALTVQEELQQQIDQADRLRQQQVERARYEADLARQRYWQVDPNNRFVADALEADWNDKLRALTQAQDNCDRQRQADRTVLDEATRQQVLALVTDFPKLWHDPNTPDRERKRIVRLLIEDVTLNKNEQVAVHVRFKGGATRSLTLPPPQPAWMSWQTNPDVIAEIDQLLDHHTDAEIATILNERGRRSGKGRPFSHHIVAHIRRDHHLKGRWDRLRNVGMLTIAEIARQLQVCISTVHQWRRCGLLKAHAYNDKNECLYEPVTGSGPTKHQGIKTTDPRRLPQFVAQTTKEVQDGA